MKKRIVATVITLFICLSSFISVSAYTDSHILDASDTLTNSEYDELESYATYIENTYGCCIMFCLTDDTDGMTGDDFAKEVYSSNTDNADGIIITHDLWNNSYHIYVSGNAKQIDDADIDAMLDAYDSNEAYYGGINDYLEKAEEIIAETVYSYEEPAKGDESPQDDVPSNDTYDGTTDEKGGVPLWRIPVALGIGFIIGFLIVYGIASKNKSVRMQKNATVYTRPGSLVITGSADNFLYKNLERREKPKQTEKK
ncbi:MAG: TPM domain-containing protein [Clostridia bacterium]|nr:TPM domain-containing protein [Clostridia bacterium]